MIRDASLALMLAVALCCTTRAVAQDEPAEDTSIERFRSPFEVLSERMIGTAARPVRFDWRKTTVGVAVFASDLLELNNFESARWGGVVRFKIGGLLANVGAAWVDTDATRSSRTLALTPYRQHGRPSRLELDFGVSLPIAEGVVTAWPGFFPATELVLSASAELRYLYYPGALEGASWRQKGQALLASQLTERELNHLADHRPDSMAIDKARYGALVGLTTDLYFHSGVFVFPKVLLAVPLLQPVTDTRLDYWWELTLGVGYAF